MPLREADYLLALSCIRGVGGARARLLLSVFGSAETVFATELRQLTRIKGIPETVAREIASADAERITQDVRKACYDQGIDMIAYTDATYPERLAQCHDAPLVLFYKGSAPLNGLRYLSIVGTRRMSRYGKLITRQLVEELSPWSPVIVSGLAYGIDITAHRTALTAGLPTVAVLPGAIDRIYPSDHTATAHKMLETGGLLSEMPPGTMPEKEYFPVRNRIIAGIADATLVVESGVSGGSMITCFLTHGYEREVLAVPGRITDPMSSGPNKLIRDQVAYPVNSGKCIAEFLGWGNPLADQPRLFDDLTPDEQAFVDLFRQTNELGVDEIMVMLGLPHTRIAGILLSLEFKDLIRVLPGNRVVLIKNISIADG